MTVAFATMTTLAAGLFLGAPGAVAAPAPPPPAPSASNPTPPPVSNPTNDQLSRADAQKAVIDQQIGTLSGEIAAAQARLDDLRRKEELAEQKVALTYTEYQEAVAAAGRAKAAATTAVAKVRDSQTRFAQYMQAEYMDGRPPGMTGTLLTASDPTALLDQTSYQQYEVEHNAGIIGQMETLSVAKSNAQARATRAQLKAKKAKAAAEQAQRDAATAVANQQSQQAGLEATMSQKQTELTAAKAQVVQLYNNRATNVEYQRERAAFVAYTTYIAKKQRYDAYVAEQKRIAAAKRAARIARAKEEAAREKARAQQDRKKGKKKRGGSSGGSSSGGSSGGSSNNDDPPASAPPAPSGGGWTQAKGNRAVARAKKYLGDTYAWAGGNAKGPTYGVCVSGAASGDCYIKGFDCSGLVMYAWGKNWAHYADTQYSQAGSYHPKISKLKPGDLMFFGYRGGGSDLHHVAMYVGHKKMIEAPQSNDVIQISSIYKYSDYYGATRPLT